jgi:hypothetical protein
MTSTVSSDPKQKSRNRLYGILLALIFLAGLGIRLFDLTDLPLDFHPTRQLRSAIIARGLYYRMHPAADTYKQNAAIQAMNSLEDYEPPIFESITAATYLVTGGEHLWIARIYSTMFWLIAALFLFLTLRRWNLKLGALLSIGIFLLAPFLVQASRSFQPDPFMVMWIAIFVYVLDRYIQTPTWKWAILTGVIGGIAILIKVVAGLFVAASLALVVIGYFGWKQTFRNIKNWVIGGLVVLPAVIYYLVILGGRSGGFFESWTLAFLYMLVDHTFYADWLHMLDGLFSLALVFTAVVGTFMHSPHPRRMVMGLWIGYVLYGLISPFQFVTHTYYHLPMALLLALGIAPAADAVARALRARTDWGMYAVLAVLVAVSGYYLWISRSVFVVDNFRSEAIEWQKIGEVLPKNGPVIALTQDYGNRLMYFGMVKASDYWPTTSGENLSQAKGKGQKDFETQFSSLTDGKRYFLVTAMGQLDSQSALKARLAGYKVVASGSGYVLYDLASPVK